eukprot:scaffold42467_cov63-Phaeocystis_antarctica.AAC.3
MVQCQKAVAQLAGGGTSTAGANTARSATATPAARPVQARCAGAAHLTLDKRPVLRSLDVRHLQRHGSRVLRAQLQRSRGRHQSGGMSHAQHCYEELQHRNRSFGTIPFPRSITIFRTAPGPFPTPHILLTVECRHGADKWRRCARSRALALERCRRLRESDERPEARPLALRGVAPPVDATDGLAELPEAERAVAVGVEGAHGRLAIAQRHVHMQQCAQSDSELCGIDRAVARGVVGVEQRAQLGAPLQCQGRGRQWLLLRTLCTLVAVAVAALAADEVLHRVLPLALGQVQPRGAARHRDGVGEGVEQGVPGEPRGEEVVQRLAPRAVLPRGLANDGGEAHRGREVAAGQLGEEEVHADGHGVGGKA